MLLHVLLGEHFRLQTQDIADIEDVVDFLSFLHFSTIFRFCVLVLLYWNYRFSGGRSGEVKMRRRIHRIGISPLVGGKYGLSAK